jgi:hypothetical protein
MYELVRRGEVSSVRLGRKVLITRSTLEELLGFAPPTPAELSAASSKERLRLVEDPVAAPSPRRGVSKDVHGRTLRR